MYADKQRHAILIAFTKIYTRILDQYKRENRQLSIFNIAPVSIYELMDNCPLKMDQKVFENHLAYFQVTGYTENIIDSKTGIIHSQLTPKGIEAYTGQIFLEKYKKDKRDKRMYHSQMDTNFYMKWATVIIAISTCAGVVFSFKSCSKEESPAVININSQSSAVSLSTKIDTSQSIHKDNHGVSKIHGCPNGSNIDSGASLK